VTDGLILNNWFSAVTGISCSGVNRARKRYRFAAICSCGEPIGRSDKTMQQEIVALYNRLQWSKISQLCVRKAHEICATERTKLNTKSYQSHGGLKISGTFFFERAKFDVTMISASRLCGASPTLSLTPSVARVVPKIICDEMWLTQARTAWFHR
jgi:hypothetical protein